jgi:hypothetical protein
MDRSRRAARSAADTQDVENMLMSTTDWKVGDRVVHAGRPEWGTGAVTSAEAAMHNGHRMPKTRHSIRTRRPKGHLHRLRGPSPPRRRPIPRQETLGRRRARRARPPQGCHGVLGELPDDATDPFISFKSRLINTLKLYRFTGTGGSLLDWATAQTGIGDPLSRFSRHELEQGFDRFKLNLEQHLRRNSSRTPRRKSPTRFAAALAVAPPAGQQALKRADNWR